MDLILGNRELGSFTCAQAQCMMMGNGLGGYASVTAGYGVDRCDQGLLIAALRAPNVRMTAVHRMKETLIAGGAPCVISTQSFADGTAPEEGWQHLRSFSLDVVVPVWSYEVQGVRVTRRLCVAYGENTTAVHYTIENHTNEACTLTAAPFFKFAPKEEALKEQRPISMSGACVRSGDTRLYIRTDGVLEQHDVLWQTLSYPGDAKDGRAGEGLCANNCRITKTVAPGKKDELQIVFSMDRSARDAVTMINGRIARALELANRCGLEDPMARRLAVSADDYISRRDSTGGKTILAGYPLFSDWGRDTMIALPGCCLATGRYEDAKSILRTFLVYEKDGLLPNLFPEGGLEPMYNTADAALLLIDCVWQLVQRTGDLAFAKEAWPVMERIIRAYEQGTAHAIGMDTDGLIRAGSGLDQVTWMDVCAQGMLPTPRHGKPVEINAYWYNALRIMELLGSRIGRDSDHYGLLADRARYAFREKFFMPHKGYLKDVLCGTGAEKQLRCNQIWAVSMAFTMLEPEQERQVVQAVQAQLFTPRGLRTLAPSDPEYRGFYGGDQLSRDLAYHQGTVWVYPMGAFFRAYLKVNGGSQEAAQQVRTWLQTLPAMLREGCLGQLPEIYDGDDPREGKGCYAQAWSVGELLRVYEALEEIQ